MLLAEHYLRLRSKLEHVSDGEEVPITLSQLGGIFVCSSRNCQMILQKLIRAEWITWTPGKGRGNHSQLSFCTSRDEILLQTAKDFVGKGELKEAIQFVDTYAATAWEKAQFHEWLGRQFGYQPLFVNNQRLDTLRLFFPNPFFCLDPAKIQYSFQKHIARQLFDSLVRFNKEKQGLEPALAHYWEVSGEGDSWQFYLRKGIVFHHGKELNARDVRYTLLRLQMLSATIPELWTYAQIRSVTCTGEYSLEIRLSQPNHGFIHYLASERASIIPEGICEQMNGRFSLQPLGTGPFRAERNECHLLVLQAHHTYFQGRAHLDQIELWVVEDKELTGKAMPADPYDLRWGPKTAKEADWKSVSRQAVGCKLLLFNMRKDGWGQMEIFRQAVLSAVDKTALLDLRGSTDRSLANRLLADSEGACIADGKADVAALLQESGYTGEALKLYTYSFQQNEEESRILVQQWADFGIKVEVTVLSPHEFGSTDYFGEADLLLFYQVADENRELFLHETYLSPRSLLRRYFSEERNREIDRQAVSILKEKAVEQRLRLLKKMEDQIKQWWAVQFLYHRHEQASHHPSLQGVTLNALGWVTFKDVWFQSKAEASG